MYNHTTFIFDGAIGEFLMVLSFFEAVHQKNPSFKAIVITARNKSLFDSLSQNYPYLEIIEKKNFKDILKKLFLTKTLILPNLSFALKENWKYQVYKKLLAFISLGKYVSYVYKKEDENQNKIFYDFEQTVYTNLTKLGKFFDLELSEFPPIFKLTTVNDFIQKNSLVEKTIILNIYASNKGRTLPVNRWQNIIKFLLEKYPGYKIGINGGPEHIEVAKVFLTHPDIFSMCEVKSLLEKANIMNLSKFIIGVDTGPTHLACLLQKDVILISNNSNPTWLPRYNPKTIILTADKNCTCDGKKGGDCKVLVDGVSYYRCMYEISDEQIFTAIEKVLK
jgi:ADP-heptose:LPS heptosyltransferase